jgi:CheY-like chemotaxis protein
VLQGGSVIGIVRWLADWFKQKYEMSVTVQGKDELPRVKSTIRLVMFQTLRELLFILKHLGQQTGVVQLACEDGWITLLVRGSQRGFEPEILRNTEHKSLGMGNIKECLEAIQGRWEIESAPGGGAHVRLSFPTRENIGRSESAPDTAMHLKSESSIRVLVADDHKMVREGLVSLLEEQPDIRVVGEAEDGEEALALAHELQPDIVVMDVEMPELNGIEATRRILRRHPGLKVIGLSMHSDKGYAEKMIAAGAAAHEEKTKASVQLINTLRLVFEQE